MTAQDSPGKSSNRILASLCLAIGLFAAPMPADAAQTCRSPQVAGGNQPVNPARINQKLLEAATMAEINYLRCKKGLPGLKSQSRMRRVAERHAKYMAKTGNLTHKSNQRGAGTPRDRVLSTGIKIRRGSENIAKISLYRLDEVGRFKIVDASNCRFASYGGQRIGRHSYASLARYVASLWYQSAAHRKNILDRGVNMSGIGAGFDANARYCGAIYITQSLAG